MRYFKTFYRQSKETGTGIQKTFTSFRRFGRKGLPAFLLTGDSRHGNIKPASQEANFISGEEAAMKTRVRELRTAAGMTQQQLAEAVRVSSRTIISIEKEQYSPSLMLAYRMAEVFGITVEELSACGRTGNWRISSMKI